VDATGAVAYARFFNPAVGIAEDLATGIAAGPKRQRPKERYADLCRARHKSAYADSGIMPTVM
jgi:hypothetical protein